MNMLSYRFIDLPTPVSRHLYDEAIQGIIGRNINLNGIKAIYKFGNITAPGISDLDLLFVFKNGAVCNANGFEGLPAEHSALFTHGIIAASEKHFTENTFYTIWSDHHLVWGESPTQSVRIRSTEEERALRIQTAIEFLMANYIDLKIQRCYKVIKLRAFLQHMKGILYDLTLLNEEHCPISIPLLQLKDWILNWFEKTPDKTSLNQWMNSFEPVYDAFVNHILTSTALFLPESNIYKIAKNMILHHRESVSYERKGVLLPAGLSVLGRKYFKLQNRLNTFTFTCPITQEAHPIVKDRYNFLKEMKAYNREHLPNFMTITTSITAKLI